MDLGPHAHFIIAAYVVTGATLLALVLWAFLGERRMQRVLSDLEARGVKRRGGG
ncbi:MAG: heme exporter protein CcmD [Hyphomicrobiales bacterium]|nr:heme exporter protein CcmD [Hyphomicrobiales bacterium]